MLRKFESLWSVFLLMSRDLYSISIKFNWKSSGSISMSNELKSLWCGKFPMLKGQIRITIKNFSLPIEEDGWESFASDLPDGWKTGIIERKNEEARLNGKRMRSSDFFVVKVLWLAGTAPDCSSAIETAGKPRGIRTRLFSLIKGTVTGNRR